MSLNDEWSDEEEELETRFRGLDPFRGGKFF